MKGLFDDPRDVVHVRDQITVLHNWQGQAEDVCLLKRSFPNHVLGHLTGDGDDGNRVEIGVGESGDQIGRAGATGGHANPGPPGRARVTLRGEGASLFVPGKDGADFLGPGERLMQFHARAARIGKDGINSFPLEGGDQDVAALHGRAHLRPLVRGRGFRFGRRLVHGRPAVFGGNRGQTKKPTTVASRGFLSKLP